MTLPNFFIIGAAKSATTSLASLIDQHPQASISQPKEPHFFSVDSHYRAGLEEYSRCFINANPETIAIGDASTSYSRLRQHPETLLRLQRHIENPKFIYMVRHPIQRIESAYVEQMTQPENAHIKSINEAIEQLPAMVDSSRYWEVYSQYRKSFAREQIMIIWFEDYSQNTKRVLSDVCKFLAIDESFQPSLNKQLTNRRQEATNRIAGAVTLDRKWKPKTLAKVKKALYRDNQKFLQYFGKPDDYWS